MRKRTRSEVVFNEVGREYVYGSLQRTHTFKFTVGQETHDETHPSWRTSPGPGGNVGGPFLSVKREYDADPYSFRARYSGNRYEYRGPMVPYAWGVQTASSSNTNWPSAAITSDINLDAYGATAISRCQPTNPVSGLSTTLGELKRDGLPALVGLEAFRKRGKPSALGGEYLNAEFGWKPLVSSVTKLAHAARDSEKILAQYERDSGKVVRRKYEFPQEVDVTYENLGTNYPKPTQVSYLHQSAGTLTKITTTTRRRWFSGAFTYYLDTGDDLRSKMGRASAEANKLYGTRITPSVLWDLAPWSWAVDWVSNTGDVLSNVSAFINDGLVMQYGYIMVEYTRSVEYVLRGYAMAGDPYRSPLYQRFTTTVKQRKAATPFGFGLDIGNFSPRQWAIIAALGISQGGRKMAI